MSWLTDRLTKLIGERGVTVDAAARQLAIERSRLTNISAGTAIPNENLTKRLANYFGESADEWLANVQKREDDKPALPTTIPGDFIKVANVSEVPEGEMKIVFHDLVVIARAGGDFYAFGNVCPHAAGPIGDGFLDGYVVECPWHVGQWDVRTGEALTLLATNDIPLFEARVAGDDVKVRLTDRALKQGVVSASGPDPLQSLRQ